jgi:hypothetical protein
MNGSPLIPRPIIGGCTGEESNLSRAKNIDARCKSTKKGRKKLKKPLYFFHSWRSLRQIYPFTKDG